MSVKWAGPEVREGAEPRTRVGALLIFRPGMSVPEAHGIVAELAQRGLLDRTRFAQTVETFDPDREGSPVWYIP